MGALDQTHANNLIDGSLGTAAFVATTTPVHLRQMTANGSASANGTELATSGGYTAGTGAPTITFTSGSSSAPVSITNMPAATINGVEIWDSAATPKRKWWGALSTPKTTNAGDTLTYASGSVTAAMP
jgi:hypothetical protein